MDIPFVKKSVVIVGSWKKSSDPSKTKDFVLWSKPTPPIGAASKPPVRSIHVSPLEKESRWVASNLKTSPGVALALAGATDPSTGTSDGPSVSRNTVMAPSQNFRGCFIVIKL
jgi:hypothetical protein